MRRINDIEIGWKLRQNVGVCATLQPEDRRGKTGDRRAEPEFRHSGLLTVVRQVVSVSVLNTSRFKKHLKVSAATAFQPLAVSKTLEVLGIKKSYSLLPRESFAWLDSSSEGSSKTAMGIKKMDDGRIKWPMEANNLSIDAFKLPIVGLNCRWMRLNCQLTAQPDGGRVNYTEKPSRFTKPLKVIMACEYQPLGVLKTLKVLELNETIHNIVISKRQRRERSVTTKQQSNRFLNRSSLGMTERLESRIVNLETKKKLTIKYINPPLKRIAGTTKNAHLSRLENRGTGDNKLFPFFLISSTLYISSPAGGSPEGEGGNGTVANIHKTSAYET